MYNYYLGARELKMLVLNLNFIVHVSNEKKIKNTISNQLRVFTHHTFKLF